MSVSEEEWARDRTWFGQDGEPAPGPLASQFADLTRTLLDVTHTVGGVLRLVVGAAVAIVPDADLVSVTLRDPDGRFHTPIETDPVAVELDLLQYDHGEGPCVDSARPDGPALCWSQDVGRDPRWPSFGPGAARHGYHSVLATALVPDARPPRLSGALNIYSRTPGAFNREAIDTALLLATHASLALAHTEAVVTAELEAEHLRRAVDSRDVIGQAKGILMQRRGIDADEAFDVLRRASQDLNVKLADLAGTLAARHTEVDLPAAGREG
ncbi:GAF and ANTAR domain-containing protein [Amycolatopsis sp. FBCC-B4732]|uniref:GAF and ANTAR domain-containing protein n=1 Tax=Amycolatopsis sp. FBCC-B4732 TaxID=3079339 RepID=UPI001FF1B064|nr:GAF and ANTAR domain-containing protein [Amycolatopsis sp. FBCC-B4732]UOX91208.1 GAF and ANTAR domain-containing protein [Amycolatopsis sp. FBCC-B4732]